MREQDIVTACLDEGEKLEWIAARSSVIGTRAYQQDTTFLYEGEKGVLAVVCDGMGGMDGGEKASYEAAKQLAKDFFAADDIADVPSFLREEAIYINRQVSELTNDDGDKLNCGTTMVAVIIQKGKLYWLSVGDSRIYFYRNGQMAVLTRDHNYHLILNERLKKAEITEEDYRREADKGEALISYLGIESLKLMDISMVPIALEPGDKVLLCSDGLYKSLTEQQIIFLMKQYEHQTQELAMVLTETATAQAQRGQDNTSVIVVTYLGGKEKYETLSELHEGV